MHRAMPRLDLAFRASATKILSIARAGEDIRRNATAGSVAAKELRPARLEALYELAYLRVFIEWEQFLEESFLRYTCGYRSRIGLFHRVGGLHHSTLAIANLSMLGGNDYVLWYPKKAIERARRHLVNSPHETVISASKTTIQELLSVRHRIAHGQHDAKNKFDAATMNLNHRRYPASQAGRFLRDWNTGVFPHVRWIDWSVDQLFGIAGLIV